MIYLLNIVNKTKIFIYIKELNRYHLYKLLCNNFLIDIIDE